MYRKRIPKRPGAAPGFTLVEAVIAIVVLSIGVVSMLSVFLVNIRHSADPMVLEQANAVARSYLEEVMLKAFCDPNDFSEDCPADCGLAACAACSGNSIDGVTLEDRGSFDDICDYDGLADNAGAVDKTGSALAGLDEFNVAVTVNDNSLLNGLSGAAGQVLQIAVSVTHDRMSGVGVQLQGYRVNF